MEQLEINDNNNRVTVELDWDTVNSIIVDSLKQAFLDNDINNGTFFHPDDIVLAREVRASIIVLLKYFMPEYDYKAWEQENLNGEDDK